MGKTGPLKEFEKIVLLPRPVIADYIIRTYVSDSQAIRCAT